MGINMNSTVNNKNKISYKALHAMEGFKVLVHDLEYDAYDQECTVYFESTTIVNKKTYRIQQRVTKIYLANDEFKFEYNFLGKPCNGDFEVYSLKKNRGDII